MAFSTIIYYTSNREDDRFEAIIKDYLIKASGDLPIISVSQKPIDLGHNICVGDVGVSNQNAHRQLQIGCKAAKTPFIHIAEADCLYPPEYFQYFPPTADRAYRTPIYLHYLNMGKVFLKKPASESATIVGREYLIDMIECSLEGRGVWKSYLEHGSEVPITFPRRNFLMFEINNPIINIKTPRGMHWRHGTSGEVAELPYWGKPEDIDKLFV